MLAGSPGPWQSSTTPCPEQDEGTAAPLHQALLGWTGQEKRSPKATLLLRQSLCVLSTAPNFTQTGSFGGQE